MTNSNELYHYGRAHDDPGKPGRGSGRYPYDPVLHLDDFKIGEEYDSVAKDLDDMLSRYNLKESEYRDLKKSALDIIKYDDNKANRLAKAAIKVEDRNAAKRASKKAKKDERDKSDIESLKEQKQSEEQHFNESTRDANKDSSEYKGKERLHQEDQKRLSEAIAKAEQKLKSRQEKYESKEVSEQRRREESEERNKQQREADVQARLSETRKLAETYSKANDKADAKAKAQKEKAEAKRREDILAGKIPLDKMSLKELKDYNAKLEQIRGIEKATGNYKYTQDDSQTFKTLKSKSLSRTIDAMSDVTKIAKTTTNLLIAFGAVHKEKDGTIVWNNKKRNGQQSGGGGS